MIAVEESRRLTNEGSAKQIDTLLSELSDQLRVEFGSGKSRVECNISEYPCDLSRFMVKIQEKGYWCSYPIPEYEYSNNQPNPDTHYDRTGYKIIVWNVRPSLFETFGIWVSYFKTREGYESYFIPYD